MKIPLLSAYKKCQLCPRKCGVDRPAGQFGFCKAPSEVTIATYQAHKFEEPPISGFRGSGTIFFSYCTARCVYCQNYAYSRGNNAKPVTIEQLTQIMLQLQERGCHNINLVTPTHYLPSIVAALKIAKAKGLTIPIVFNTSGYECLDMLRLLEGWVDIYLPDAKYSDDTLAKEHCQFIDYSKYNIPALKEMYRQVGNLKLDKNGVAKKGLIIRHLVLPGYLDNTRGVLQSIRKEISNKVYISLMNQYSPIVHTKNHPNLGRRLTKEEYEQAKSYMEALGFSNGWVQE